MECPICLESLRYVMMTPCGHSICKDCLNMLVSLGVGPTVRFEDRNVSCPICRKIFVASTAVPTRVDTTSSSSSYSPRHDQTIASENRPCKAECMRTLMKMGATLPFAEHLYESQASVRLRVYVLDDSGSTCAHDGTVLVQTNDNRFHKRTVTRWDEVKNRALEHATYNLALGVSSEFFLLNGRKNGGYVRLEPQALYGSELDGYIENQLSYFKSILDKTHSHGGTPLAETLQKVQHRIAATNSTQLSAEKPHVFVVIITDGIPNNRYDMIATMRTLASQYPVTLVLRLCTDERNVINYWNQLDDEVEFPLDIVDDIFGEAKEVASAGNSFINYWPFFHLVREAGLCERLFDILDEKKFIQAQVCLMIKLLLGVGNNYDLISDQEKDSYINEVSKASADQLRWNSYTNRLEPIISEHELRKVLHKTPLWDAFKMIVFICLVVVILLYTFGKLDSSQYD